MLLNKAQVEEKLGAPCTIVGRTLQGADGTVHATRGRPQPGETSESDLEVWRYLDPPEAPAAT